MKSKSLRRFVSGMVFGFILCVPSFVHGAIANFHEVEEGFFRGGQPDEKGVEALKTLGIRTVISFRNEKKVIEWERALVEKNGMSFISIPLTWRRSPTDEQVHYFLNVVSQPDRRPLFIHCREGRDRTGAMVALYRIARQRCPVEDAYREAKRFGFRERVFPLKRFILVKAKTYTELSKVPFDFFALLSEVLFYVFESLVAFFGFAGGVTCLKTPDLAIKIQKRFYELINWQIIPISMAKEVRNTRILGGILLSVSLMLVVSLFLFSI